MSRRQLHVWNNGFPLVKVVFTGDGSCAVAMNNQGKVLAWNVQSGTVVSSTALTYKFKSQMRAPYSPSGRFMFVPYPDHTVRIWDVQKGTQLPRSFRGHTKKIESIDVSSKGNRILTSSQDATVRLWDFQSGSEIERFVEHRGHVACAAFSPTDNLALSGGKDATVRLWKLS